MFGTKPGRKRSFKCQVLPKSTCSAPRTCDSINRNDERKEYDSNNEGDNEAPPVNFVQRITIIEYNC